MATTASTVDFVTPERAERRFFFVMALIMTTLIVAGFSLNLAMGRSSFDVAAVYHVHAVVMMAGLGLHVMQTGLIAADRRALHRKLGWIAVIWVPLMALSGLLVMRYAIQAHGGPFVFDMNHFLVSNSLHMAGFVALIAWAIVVRTDTGWHRRLIYCGFAMLLGPGIGRLLPTPLFMPYAWYAVAVLPPLVFMLIGVAADRRRHGKAHPAWLRGIGVLIGLQLLADIIAYSPLGYQFTEWFVAGTPGAERPMEAFLPPGFSM